MSTRYLTRAAVLAALVLCGTAHAAEAWHQDYVKWIYPLSNGNFVLAFASSPATMPTVTSPVSAEETTSAFADVSIAVASTPSFERPIADGWPL